MLFFASTSLSPVHEILCSTEEYPIFLEFFHATEINPDFLLCKVLRSSHMKHFYFMIKNPIEWDKFFDTWD
ncbi:hypothetical protein Nepgr_025197 [Nepenthes gracilis]|uniref:Uncharacterized protein n=1 Tax=Nepenthes gracilis TaxID=150966 RepID=A0AAD3Y0R5_NEPGR|nr:hypothetical protein Nepgr_025197 [Nepenthes gracilis]